MSLDLAQEFQELIAAFEAAGIDYAVVGALAVANRPQDIADIQRLEELDR